MMHGQQNVKSKLVVTRTALFRFQYIRIISIKWPIFKNETQYVQARRWAQSNLGTFNVTAVNNSNMVTVLGISLKEHEKGEMNNI